MIKNTTAFHCSPRANLFSPRRTDTGITRRRQFKLISFAALAVFSLLLAAPLAAAQTRAKRAHTKTEGRSRRVNDKKQPTKIKENVKRVNITRSAQPPAVRKTVIVSSKQSDNRAARSALVNDIVIISEAPVASRLPTHAPNIKSSNMPSIWPVAGAMRGGYGVRRNPFGGRSSEFHKGQDISAPMGTPVIATADGVVTIAGRLRGYGNVVYLDHGNGLTTRYGHLSQIDVVVGQTIQRGSQLGLVGSTGRSTGPHLHYEVRVEGQPIDPLPYLPNVQTLPASAQKAAP
jgi:murein DD-endopeptidase MepM/ murein hydrolase activator NlpD